MSKKNDKLIIRMIYVILFISFLDVLIQYACINECTLANHFVKIQHIH